MCRYTDVVNPHANELLRAVPVVERALSYFKVYIILY